MSHRVLAQSDGAASVIPANELTDEPLFVGQAAGRWERGTEPTNRLRVARSAEVRVLYDAGNDRACSGRDTDPDFEKHTATDLLWLVRVGRDDPRDSLSSLAAVTFDDEGVITRLSLSRLC